MNKEDQSREQLLAEIENLRQKCAEATGSPVQSVLKNLVKDSPLAVAVFDTDMRYLYASDLWYRDYGLGDQEIIGKTHYEVFPEVPERWKEIHRRCLAGATETAEADPFPRGDGHTDYVRWEVRPWYSEAGEVGGLVMYTAVITAQIEMMQQAEWQGVLLAEGSELAGIAYWEFDFTRQVFLVGEDFYRRMGKPSAAGIGNELTQDKFIELFVHAEDVKEVYASIQAALDSTDPDFHFSRIFRSLDDEGIVHFQKVSYRIKRAEDGEPERLIGANVDVTEQVQTQEAIRQSQERYQIAVEGSNDGLWDWYLPTNEVYFSPRWKAMIGYRDNELANDFALFEDHLHPEDHDRVMMYVNDYLQGKHPVFEIEFRFRHKDGSYRWILARATVQRDAAGQPVRIAGSHSDITARKMDEEVLAKRAKELQTVAEISTAVVTIKDPQKLLEKVTSLTQRQFDLYHCHIFVMDDAGEKLQVKACGWQVGDPHEGTHADTVIALAQETSLVAQAARTRKAVVVNNVYEDPHWLPNEALPETKSEMAVPMVVGDEVLGVLDVQSSVINRFTEEDIAIKMTLASQVAVALQNARQYAEIHQNQAQLAEALDLGKTAYWEFDVATGMFEFNDQWFKVWRTTPEEHGGYQMSAEHFSTHFFEPHVSVTVGQTIGAALTTDDPNFYYEEVVQVRFGDGAPGYILLRFRIEKDEEGRTVKLVGTNQDVTESREREENLRQLAAVMEQSLDGMAVADLDGHITFVNPSWARMHGYLPEDLLGKHLSMFHNQEQIEKEIIPINDRVIATGEAQQAEINHVRKDGSVFPTWMTIGVLKSAQGESVGLVASAQDISERKEAEQRLAESEEYNKLIFTSSQMPLVVMKADTAEYVDCNPAAAKAYGFASREEVIGKNPLVVSAPVQYDGSPSAELAVKYVQECIEQGAVTFEWLHQRPDGEQWDADVQLTLFEAGDQQLIQFSLRDITENKRTEKLLQKRAAELETVATVSAAASGTLEPDKFLQEVVDLTKERFELYQAHIYLVDETGEDLTLAAGSGEAGRLMTQEGWRIPLAREQSLVAQAARERRGVTVNDVTVEPGFMPNQYLPETRAELAVPLIVGDQVLGVLDVQSVNAGRFTEEDVRIQTTLAAQIAVALQNARSYAEMQASETLVRSIIDATPDWIFIKDRQHRYRMVNQGYANSMGRTTEEIVGLDDLDIGFPEDIIKGNPEKGIRGFWADDTEVMNRGEMKVVPSEPAEVGGEARWLNTIKVPLKDEHGYAWGVLGFVRDITERESLLEDVRQSQVFLSTMIDNIPNPVFYKDLEGRYLGCNQAFLDYLGTTRDEILGKSVYDLNTDRELADKYHAMDVELFEKSGIQVYEAQVKYADGSLHDVIFNKASLVDANGKVTGLVGTIVDITERKHAEALLTKRAGELETVANVSAAASGTLEPDKFLQEVVDLTKERFELYHAHIYLIDESGEKLVLAAGAGEAGRTMVAEDWQIPMTSEKSLVAQAAREAKGVTVNDVTEEPDFLPNPLLPDTHSEMAVPMIAGDQVLGVLDVQSVRVGRFTDEDVRIKTTLAAQVAVALQNARRHEEVRLATYNLGERVKELNCLNDIGQKIQEQPQVEELLNWVCERIPPAMQFPDVCVAAVVHEEQTFGDPQAVDSAWQIHQEVEYLGQIFGTLHIAYTAERGFLAEEYDLLNNIVRRVAAFLEGERLNVQLATERNTLNAVLQSIPAGVFVVEAPSGRPLIANEQAVEMMGKGVDPAASTDELAEVYAAFLYGTEEPYPAEKMPLVRGMFGEQAHIDDMELHHPDGSRRLLDIHGAPIYDNQGKIASSVAIFQDITEQRQAQEALRMANMVVENSTAVLFLWKADEGWPVVYVSENVKQFGYGPESFLNGKMAYADIIHPADLPGVERGVDEHVTRGEDRFSQDYRVITREGEIRWVEERTVVQRDAQGVVAGYQGLVLDVTERKQMEQTLRENQAQLAEALELGKTAYWEFNVATGTFEFNDQWFKVWRTTPEEHGGYQMSAEHFATHFFEPHISATIGQTIGAALSTDDPNFYHEQVVQVRFGDGTAGFILLRFRIEKDAEGRTVRLVGTNQDVTESRQREEDLRRLATVVEQSLDGLAVADMDGHITFANPAWARMHGYTPEELIGGHLSMFHTVEQLEKEVDPNNAEVMRTGKGQQAEVGHVRKDGVTFPTWMTVDILRDANGQPTGLVASAQDITERKQAEELLAKRAAELETVAKVSTAVATVMESQEILQAVVDLTKESFELYHAHVYLVDESGEKLVLAAGAGEAGRAMVAQGWQIPLDSEKSLVAQAAREAKGVTVNDVTEAPDFLPNPLLPDTRSEMAVPMIVGDQVLGVLDVQSVRVGRFTEEDVRIKTTLAAQIAVALQNAREHGRVVESEKLVRTIIDATPDWIFIKDQDYRYRIVNKGYADALHIAPEEFIGKNDLELGFPEELVKGNPEKGIRGFWTDDRLVMDSGEPHIYPEDPATIDGKVHVFHTYKTPLRNESGEVWGVLAFSRDITERENLLKEVRRSQNFLRSLIDNIPNPVYYKDGSGLYAGSNAAFLEMVGFATHEQLEGKTVYEVHEDQDLADNYRARDEALLQKAGKQAFEERVRFADGSLHDMLFSKASLVSEDGKVTGLVGTLVDITERKKVEEQLAQTLAETERQAQNLMALNELGAKLNRAATVKEIMDVATRGVLQITSGERSTIAMLDEGQEAFQVYALTGLEGVIPMGKHLPVEGTGVGKCIREGRVLIMPEDFPLEETLDGRMLSQQGIVTTMNAPLVSGGKVVGTINVASSHADTFSTQDRSLMLQVAALVASAIENRNLFAQVEIQLREIQANREQLAEALKIGNTAYFEFDVATSIFLFNDAWFELFRTSVAEQGGYEMPVEKFVSQFVPEETRAHSGEVIMTAITSEDLNYFYEEETPVVFGDGERGTILLRLRIEKDAEGQTVKMYGTNQDITERQRAYAALEASQRQLAEALRMTKMGYWEYEVDRDTFIFNDQFYSLFYTTAAEQGGTEMPSAIYAQRFVDPNSAHLVGESVQQALTTTDPNFTATTEAWHIRADGSPMYLRVQIWIEKDAQGRTVKMLGANQDITERKMAEEMVAKRAAELGTVARISTTVATILDPQQILQTVVDLTKENFHLYHTHIYLIDESGENLVLAAGAGEVGRAMVQQGWEIPLSREKSLVAQAARLREGVVANDVRAEIGYMPNPLLPETAAEMAIPLMAGDKVLGVLDVQSAEVNHFTEEDIRINTTLSAQVAVALQNARTLEAAQRQAEYEAMINAISQHIQTTTTVEQALQVAVRELGRALGATRTSVMLDLKHGADDGQSGNGQHAE